MPKPKSARSSQTAKVQIRETPAGEAFETESTDTIPTAVADPELPHSYGSDTLFLVAQEPHWLFCYWDIDISKHPGGPSYLRVCKDDGDVEDEIEVPFETRNWYIPVKNSDAVYGVEIGYFRNAEWQVIARSIPVRTPSDHVSDSDEFSFATIPFQVGLQRLAHQIDASVQAGETFAQTLARLQRLGAVADFDAPILAAFLAPENRDLLSALLGSDIPESLTSSTLNSETLSEKIRKMIEDRLSSAGASELHVRISEILSSGSFSGELAELRGESLTSWEQGGVGLLSSWATALLGSKFASSEFLTRFGADTSWSGPVASSWAKAALSSWLESTGSVPTSAMSGWLEFAGSSGFTGSSGQVGIESSWTEAAQSSWTKGPLSSWSKESLTSFTEAMGSSFGGSFESATNREFFMHVNAEVIFYGGTHPDASVTIDGKPIQLEPDGTFRYHFVFPNHAHDIEISAKSPDGVESRSATLSLDRATSKSGKVDDTGQPPLGDPMGRLEDGR